MKKRKNIIVFLLTLLTFGLYVPIFMYSISEELEMEKDFDEKNIKLIKTKKEFILLHIFTFGLYSLIWFYNLGVFLDKKRNTKKYEKLFTFGFFFMPLGVMYVQKSLTEDDFEPKIVDDKKVGIVDDNDSYDFEFDNILKKYEEDKTNETEEEKIIKENNNEETFFDLEIDEKNLYLYNKKAQ